MEISDQSSSSTAELCFQVFVRFSEQNNQVCLYVCVGVFVCPYMQMELRMTCINFLFSFTLYKLSWRILVIIMEIWSNLFVSSQCHNVIMWVLICNSSLCNFRESLQWIELYTVFRVFFRLVVVADWLKKLVCRLYVKQTGLAVIVWHYEYNSYGFVTAPEVRDRQVWFRKKLVPDGISRLQLW